MESYERDTGKQLSEKDRQLLRDGMLNPQDFRIDVRKDFTLRALAMHEKFVPLFHKMNWKVLRVTPPRFLITSDTPLVYCVPEQYRHPINGGGLAHKMIEVTLPLSSQACLFATWNENENVPVEVGREEVKYLNRVRAVHAMRYLYAPIKDAGVRALGKKYRDVKPGMKISGAGPKKYSPVTLKRPSHIRGTSHTSQTQPSH